MKKTIKNYTTDVPVHQTISEIQKTLVDNGAKNIMFDYDDDKQISAVMFSIEVEDKRLFFKLPAKANQVYQSLFASMKYSKTYEASRQDRSRKIAWRIIKDWLESQITLINLDQAKMQEVFLPYLLIGQNETLYEKMESSQFLLPG